MKIDLSLSCLRKQNASAVLIVIILLGIMLALIASSTANLNQLKQELDLIEQKQLKRQSAPKIPVAVPHKP